MSIFLTVLALLLLLAGTAGTILPAIPGLPLMFAGAWLLAYTQDYAVYGSTTLIALGILAAIGMAMDFVASLLGAKYTGASKQALWGAFLGGIVGIFFSLPGLILGPLIGAAAGEFLSRRDLLTAGKVGIGTFAGFIVGTVAKIGTALAILLTVLVQYLFYWFS